MQTLVSQHAGKISLMLLMLIAHFLNSTSSFSTFLTGDQAALLQETNAIFVSIIIEALPLVLVGIFVSAFLQVFVSDELLRRLLPRNRFFGILAGCLLGIFFPLCECGIVPIIRRLIQKGVPAYIAISFMLAAPVINPLVTFSTYLAFNAYPTMVVYRLLGTIAATIAVASILSIGKQGNPLLHAAAYSHCCSHDHQHDHTHHQEHPYIHHSGFGSRLQATLFHACDEFFDMGRFLLIGSFWAAVIQVSVPRTELLAFGQDSLWSVIGMMGFAFLISVCSQADAFIAAPFLTNFTTGSIAAFLIYGPMLDIKNTIMLCSTFKAIYVMKLMFLITIAVLALTLSINLLPQLWEVMLGG